MATIATISKEELKRKMEQHEAMQIVNVLAPEYYYLGSIKSSLRIPLDDLEDRLGELDKSREIVVYCASIECSASRKAAEMLSEKNFDVKAYEGGIKEWKEAGFPIEKTGERKVKKQQKNQCCC